MLLRFIDELIADDFNFIYDFQLYECLFKKWISREKRNIRDNENIELAKECEQLAKAIYHQWLKNGRLGIYFHEVKEQFSFDGIAAMQLKGHALLNRTKDGQYKFSHKSYWEYLIAKLALSDVCFADELLIKNFD